MPHKTNPPLKLLLTLVLLAAPLLAAPSHVSGRQQPPQAAPRDAAGFFARAVERHRAGRLEEAVADYFSAVRLKPEVAAAHINLGLAYVGLGRFDDAVASLNQALRLAPDTPEIHFNLGAADMAARKYADAVAAFDDAARLRPEWVMARAAAGLARSRAGRHTETLEAFRQAVRIDPRHADANLKLGMEYLFNDDPTGARQQYYVLRDLDPEAARTLLRLIEK